MTLPRDMPIRNDNDITSIPMELLIPHEVQALRNHAQPLERLANRGGVTPEEALAIIEERPWQRMPFTEAREKLRAYMRGPVNHREPGEYGDGATVLRDINRDPIREALELVRNMRDGRVDKARYNFNKLEVLLERAIG